MLFMVFEFFLGLNYKRNVQIYKILYVPKNLFHLPSELLYQELAGGGVARGRTVEEAVPKGVGQRGGRKKDALAEHKKEDVQGGGR
jgi:hypothetical protein